MVFETFDPREIIRQKIGTICDTFPDGTKQYGIYVLLSTGKTIKVPIYLTEEIKSNILPSLPYIEFGLMSSSSIPHDIGASTRKNETIIDLHIWYTSYDDINQIELGKKISDKLSYLVRTYQTSTNGIHFYNIRNTGRMFPEIRGRQVVYHKIEDLYALWYDNYI